MPNHPSDQHDWFRQALAEGPGLPLRARYHFRGGRGPDGSLPLNDWPSIFGGPAWTRAPDGRWYLLDVGESPCFDRDGVPEIYRSSRRILDDYPGERVAVAEDWAPTLARVADYVRADELHQAFNFSYLSTAWDGPAQREMIDASLAAMNAVGALTTWTLSNHDVVRHTNRLMQTGAGEVAGRRPAEVDQVAGLRRARAATVPRRLGAAPQDARYRRDDLAGRAVRGAGLRPRPGVVIRRSAGAPVKDVAVPSPGCPSAYWRGAARSWSAGRRHPGRDRPWCRDRRACG